MSVSLPRKVQEQLLRGVQVKRPFLPGSHIYDLVALRKLILLCGNCEHKFPFKRAKYKRRITGPVHPVDGPLHRLAVGPCDGCKEPFTRVQAFMPEEGF